MFPASVPGAVQKDYGAFMDFEPFYKGAEFKKFAFCEDKFWHYKAKLCFTAAENETAYLCFDGADYSCSVKIDGETVYKHTGMFSPFRIEVTKYSGLECDLEIVFDPVPKCGRTNDRNGCRKHCFRDTVGFICKAERPLQMTETKRAKAANPTHATVGTGILVSSHPDFGAMFTLN